MKHETKPGWKPWRPPPPQDDRWTRWGFRGMTVRDWLDLLIVPVMLALFAGFFTTVQAFWQTAAEDARQQALAKQTAQIQRFVEEFRVQEASLQQYLDLMTNLLIKYALRDSQEGSEVRAIAQAQTLTTLRKMDPQGKRTVVLFLSDAGLIQQSLGDTTEPIVKLSEADLSEADLTNADLGGAVLRNANLSGAHLRNANLSDANLHLTDLSGADLSGAHLSGADLFDANLFGADLREADLRNANLSDATLNKATLSKANLGGAELDRANLGEAVLSGADLSGADLSGATGITTKELEQQAGSLAGGSLAGAIMPDGSRHP